MIHFHKKNHVIGLDIDDVLADFRGGYSEWINKDYRGHEHFYFSYGTNDQLLRLDDEFWLNLKPKVDGRKLPFMPRCYVSTRAGLNESVSQEWLERNGFPCVPVIHVNGSKSDACRSMGVDIFVDDFIKKARFQADSELDNLLNYSGAEEKVCRMLFERLTLTQFIIIIGETQWRQVPEAD